MPPDTKILPCHLHAGRSKAVAASLILGSALAFVLGGLCMKMSGGVLNSPHTLAYLTCFLGGACLQAMAMKEAELSVTYLMVVGLECVLAFASSVAVLGERVTVDGLLGALLVLLGVLSLKSPAPPVRRALHVLVALALAGLFASAGWDHALAQAAAVDPALIAGQEIEPSASLDSWPTSSGAIVFLTMASGAALSFVIGGVFMKLSDGARRQLPTLSFLACFAIGAVLQAVSMQDAAMGVTYLVIVGLECVLAFACGVIFFGESLSRDRMLGVAVVIIGILALKISAA